MMRKGNRGRPKKTWQTTGKEVQGKGKVNWYQTPKIALDPLWRDCCSMLNDSWRNKVVR